jgi:hypothetical protein
MLIIVDRKIPREAKEKLSASGTLLELETEGIVYPAVSGHPDIFFCKTPQTLVVSPSLPEKYSILLNEHGIPFVTGNQASGIKHPASVCYNAAVNDRYLVHRLEYTDPVILQNCHTLKKIPVKQAYTRCSLLLLKDHHYITSDRGIHRNLQRSGLKGIFVSPAAITLPGFPNGLIGGTMAVMNRFVYVIGNFSHYPEGNAVREFFKDLDYSVIELYDGPLCDGGGILFL